MPRQVISTTKKSQKPRKSETTASGQALYKNLLDKLTANKFRREGNYLCSKDGRVRFYAEKVLRTDETTPLFVG